MLLYAPKGKQAAHTALIPSQQIEDLKLLLKSTILKAAFGKQSRSPER